MLTRAFLQPFCDCSYWVHYGSGQGMHSLLWQRGSVTHIHRHKKGSSRKWDLAEGNCLRLSGGGALPDFCRGIQLWTLLEAPGLWNQVYPLLRSSKRSGKWRSTWAGLVWSEQMCCPCEEMAQWGVPEPWHQIRSPADYTDRLSVPSQSSMATFSHNLTLLINISALPVEGLGKG